MIKISSIMPFFLTTAFSASALDDPTWMPVVDTRGYPKAMLKVHTVHQTAILYGRMTKLTNETSSNLSANFIHSHNTALKVYRNRIECRVDFDGPVSLAIYSLNGQKQEFILNNEYKKAGVYYFNMSNLLLSRQMYTVRYSGTRNLECLPVFVE